MSRREVLVLVFVVVIGFLIRMATFRYEQYGYFLAFDPGHHFRVSEYIAKTGEMPILWMLSNYPYGAYVVEPFGLYYVSVVVHKLAGWLLGLSFRESFFLTPALIGSLTLVPVYLLLREAASPRAGFYGAMLLALMPANISRSVAGYYRGDAFFLFFAIFAFYFFVRSMKESRLRCAFISGVMLGLSGFVWNGHLFAFVVLAAFLAAHSLLLFLRRRSDTRLMLRFSVAVLTGIAMIKLSVLFQPTRWDTSQELLAISFSALGFSLLLHLLRRHRLLLLPIAGAALAAAWVLLPMPVLIKQLITGYGLVKPTGFPYDTIAELRPTSLGLIKYRFRLIAYLFPAGLALIAWEWMRERRPELMIIIAWALGSLYLMHAAIRYTFLASPAMAVLAAYLLYRLEHYLRPRAAAWVIASLLLGSMSMVATDFAWSLGPAMSPEWNQALHYLKKQEPGSVMVWWDQGGWTQGVTGFPTMLDGTLGQKLRVMCDYGWFMKQRDESAAQRILRKYHIRYVLISPDLLGKIGNIFSVPCRLWENDMWYTYYTYNRSGSFMGYPAKFYVSSNNRSFYVLNVTEANTSKLVAVFWSRSDASLWVLSFRDRVELPVLRRIFAEHGINLSAAARLERRSRDIWKLYDGNQTYTLFRNEKGVHVYTRDVAVMDEVYYRDWRYNVTRYRIEAPPPGLENITFEIGTVFVTDTYLYYISPGVKGTHFTSLIFLMGYDKQGYEPLIANRHVRIYRASYNYTWIDEMNTSRIYYARGEPVSLRIKLSTTTPFSGMLGVSLIRENNPWSEDDDEPVLLPREWFWVSFNGSTELVVNLSTPEMPLSRSIYTVNATLYDRDMRAVDSRRWMFRVKHRYLWF